MKLIPKILTSILFVTLLSGCTISLSCVLLNNTPNLLTIHQFDRSNRADKINTVSKGKSVRLKSWEYSKFKIISEQETWSYSPEYPWVDYSHFTGWGPWTKRVFYAQIEPNGLIYVLKDRHKKPVSDFPFQPDGFPIKPETKK